MKLTTVQALRAIAALLVTIYHLFLNEQAGITNNGSSEVSSLLDLTRNGFAGVDMFFVISGFIMVYVTDTASHGKFTSLDFLLARLARIYPLWWLFSLLFLIMIIVGTGQLTPASYGIADDQTASYLLRSFMLWPQEKLPYIVVGWTLIHELYFYLVFAGFLLAPRAWLPGLTALWCAALLLGTAAGFATAQAANNVLSLVFHPLTLEFILGMGVGLAVTKNVRRLALPALVAGTAVFVAALLLFTPEMTGLSMNWSRIAVFGLPSALILYGLVSLELQQGWTASSRLVYLGDASYALYLCHLVVYLMTLKAFEILAAGLAQLGLPAWLVSAVTLGHAGPVDNILFAVVAFSGSMVCATLTYSFLEKQSLAWLSRQRRTLMNRLRQVDGQ